MSRGRRATALAAIVVIGVAGVLAAAQWIWDAGNNQPQLLTHPAVVANQAAVRPVEGRPLEWWGRTNRRPDRSVGAPRALAGGLSVVVVALALAWGRSSAAARLSLTGAAQERAPPFVLVP